MSELAQTPAAAQQSALQKIKAREDAIRANGIKEGRAKERAEIMQALGVQTIADASQLATIRAERDARPTQTEEQKHGRFRFYQGAVLGMTLGGALIAVVASLLLQEAFRQAGQYGREMAVTGAIAQGVRTPERCIPGETLQDGRVCPQAP